MSTFKEPLIALSGSMPDAVLSSSSSSLSSLSDDNAVELVLNEDSDNIPQCRETNLQQQPCDLRSSLSKCIHDDKNSDNKTHFYNLETISGDNATYYKSRCYFSLQQKGSLNFRHGGNPYAFPPKIFIPTKIVNERVQNDAVHVFWSASGTGKTAELAASSITRKAFLTLILDVTKLDEGHNLHTDMEKDERDQCIVDDMKDQVKKHLSGQTGLIRILGQAMQDATETSPLRIVIAIDEASYKSIYVRGIISKHNTEEMQSSVFSAIEELYKLYREQCGNNDANEVTSFIQNKHLALFSVAGTGVSSSSIGSIPQHFKNYSPIAATDSYTTLIDVMLNEVDVPDIKIRGHCGQCVKLSSFETIQQYLPNVAILMENGRMASIVLDILPKIDKDLYYDESCLAVTVIEKYTKSNGLCDLLYEEKCQYVASCALASWLFQWRKGFPSGKMKASQLETLMSQCFCGVHFVPFEGLNMQSLLYQLVTTYGLLEPSNNDFWKRIPPGDGYVTVDDGLFQLKDPLLLVVFHLLGLSFECMFEKSFVGYEFLCTQLIKSTISASSVVSKEKELCLKHDNKKLNVYSLPRLALKGVLEEIGVEMNSKNVQKDTKSTWKKMGLLYVSSPNKFVPKRSRNGTKQLSTKICLTKMKSKKSKTREEGNGSMNFAIEQDYLNELNCYKNENVSKRPQFPLARINYGNSPLPDGFVTFQVEDKKENKSMFTIMIQAKDLGANSVIDRKQMFDHVDKLRPVGFDEIFGSRVVILCTGKQLQCGSLGSSTQINYLHHSSQSEKYKMKKIHDTLRKKTKRPEVDVATINITDE